MDKEETMITMLYDNILIKDLEKKTKVVIADKHASIPYVGEVVAVGPGDSYGYPKEIATTVKAGDKVRFLRDRAYEIDIEGKTFYVVKERDCLIYERD